MKKALATAVVVTVGFALSQFVAQPVKADPEDKITICHGAGRDGTTHFETLTISRNAVYQDQGQGGHFYENGTPKAGHEQDYFGECRTANPSTNPSTNPSPSVSASATPTPTPTPAPSNNNSNNDSNNSNNSGSTSSGDNTNSGEVLGAYAGTGVVEDAIMNAVGALGGLMTTAGSFMYGKKKSPKRS